jgi:hypothetical protein
MIRRYGYMVGVILPAKSSGDIYYDGYLETEMNEVLVQVGKSYVM